MHARFPAAFAIALSAALWITQGFAQAPAAPRFEIRQFVIEGNSLLPKSDVEAAVAPYAGTDRDFGDVQRALEALQETYLSRGFTAVRVLIPEQDIRAGQVRLQVIEARLRLISVQGNRFFDQANIRASLPALKEGAAPNASAIGENLQLANENPAKQASVSLQASEEPGKIDATVRVTDDQPSRVSAFLDNTGTSATGYYRAGIGYQNANVANRDHAFSAQLITSPTRVSDVTIAGLGYHIPVYAWKGAFDFFAGYSNVNAGTVQNLFTVSGSGSIFGARFTRILPRIEAYEQKLAFGWDYRNFRQNVVLVGTSGTLIPEISVQPLSLTYTGRLSRVGRDLTFFGSYSHNLPVGSDGDQNAFTAQRAGATANYSILRMGAAYSQVFGGDYLLRAAFNGQYTRDLLVSGEQFGMGGMDSVRGFLERETANDVGHRFSLEGYTPDFGQRVGDNWRARALAFADMAHGYDQNLARGQNNGLASVGVGVRLNQGKKLSVRMDLAHIINAGAVRPNGSDRVSFSLAYSW